MKIFFCVQSVEGRPEWDVTKQQIEASDIGTDYTRFLHAKGETVTEFLIRVLDEMYATDADLCVRFEDDLSGVNKHIRFNIETWPALIDSRFGIGWLMTPGGYDEGHKWDHWWRGPLHMSQGVVMWRKDIPAIRQGCLDYWKTLPPEETRTLMDVALSDAVDKVLDKHLVATCPSLVRHNPHSKSILGSPIHPQHDTDFGSYRENWRRGENIRL
jgi:hypothetical protein